MSYLAVTVSKTDFLKRGANILFLCANKNRGFISSIIYSFFPLRLRQVECRSNAASS
jgi:hypothetical protein